MNNALIDIPINVRNLPWKAVGDGVADDTNAINAALNYAAATGGTVDFPSGHYSLSAPLDWAAPNLFIRGDGGAVLVPSAKFVGASVIAIGSASAVLTPTLGGGIDNIAVDLSNNSNPDLVAVQLIQAWFTHIRLLKIRNPNGLAVPIQTAFQISAGALDASVALANWSGSISVFDLQITGSFKTSVSHVSGVADATKAQVNGVTYFGGFAFGAGKDKVGTYGVRFETGDSTRVYGFALEDFATGCYVGTNGNGPLDFRMEDCAVKFEAAPGVNYLTPCVSNN